MQSDQRTGPNNRFPVHLLFAGIVLLGCVDVVSAVSVSEYHDNLKRSITALDTLMQNDEEETFTDFRKRLDDTLAAVRLALPKAISVECGEEFCQVDNSWLYEELQAVERALDSDWEVPLSHIVQRLKAIEERVAELRNPGDASSSKASDKEKLSEILNRADYQTKNPGKTAIARLTEAFVRWLSKLFGRRMPAQTGAGSSIGLIVQVLVVVLALALLTYIAWLLIPRLWRPRSRKEKMKAEPRIVLGERLEPEHSAVDLLSEAENLARQGQVRLAIRKAYIALLVELGDRKLISLAQHKTNRDYLRSLRSSPALYPLMTGITDSFERHWYGFVQATVDDWQLFREKYKTALRDRT